MRGSHVTTIDGRFCGAIARGGFGSELFTGRQTQDNILKKIFSFDVVLCSLLIYFNIYIFSTHTITKCNYKIVSQYFLKDFSIFILTLFIVIVSLF